MCPKSNRNQTQIFSRREFFFPEKRVKYLIVQIVIEINFNQESIESYSSYLFNIVYFLTNTFLSNLFLNIQ